LTVFCSFLYLPFQTSISLISSSFMFSSYETSPESYVLVSCNSYVYLASSSTRYSFSFFQSCLDLSFRIISCFIFRHKFLFISFSSRITCYFSLIFLYASSSNYF
jgi:hypothetical protein